MITKVTLIWVKLTVPKLLKVIKTSAKLWMILIMIATLPLSTPKRCKWVSDKKVDDFCLGDRQFPTRIISSLTFPVFSHVKSFSCIWGDFFSGSPDIFEVTNFPTSKNITISVLGSLNILFIDILYLKVNYLSLHFAVFTNGNGSAASSTHGPITPPDLPPLPLLPSLMPMAPIAPPAFLPPDVRPAPLGGRRSPPQRGYSPSSPPPSDDYYDRSYRNRDLPPSERSRGRYEGDRYNDRYSRDRSMDR